MLPWQQSKNVLQCAKKDIQPQHILSTEPNPVDDVGAIKIIRDKKPTRILLKSTTRPLLGSYVENFSTEWQTALDTDQRDETKNKNYMFQLMQFISPFGIPN